jgi:hypothetical protein
MKTCNICKNKFEVVSEMDANNNICGSCRERTWYRDFRADIKLKDGMYEYWLSECFNSERDVYWTKSRYEPDVFEAMRKAEIWLKQYANTYWDELYEEDEPEMF